MTNPETWRLIPSLPGVLASSRGRVMIAPFFKGIHQYGGRARSGSWDGNRYILMWKGKSYKIARLVCEAFHGKRPFTSAVCMHKDENARNNHPRNLMWGTQRENLNAPGFIAYCKSRIGANSPAIKGRQARTA